MVGSSQRTFWVELITLFIIWGVILIGEWLGLITPIATVFEKSLQPTIVKISRLTFAINQPFLSVNKSYKAAKRVQELEQEYSQSLARISQLEYLEQENQELRRLLEVHDRSESMNISSPVISRGQPSLSVGEADGVKLGQPVLAAQTLVGVIDSVSTHQSMVSLLPQVNSQPLLAQTETGVKGIVIGDGKQIILTELPKDAVINVGERVLTMGQEQIKPHLLLGQVQLIIDEPAAPIKQAILEQSASFYEVSIVEIMP
jgi:rod shape-determining protein MreC